MHKAFFLIFIFSFIYKTLYAPPLQRGGMSCKNYISACSNQLSKDCKNNTNWALALTANIGNNEINFNSKDFMLTLLNKCKSFPELFIESIATIIDLEYENKL